MSTPKSKKNTTRHSTYLKRYDELKLIHKFSFHRRPKNEFTGSQKAAITRLYNEHKTKLKNIREGRGVFKKTTKQQNKQLRKIKIKNEGFGVTNRGMYVPGVRPEDIRKKRHKISLKGEGKSLRVEVQLPSRREEFFPYDEPYWRQVDFEKPFEAFAEYIIKTKKPDEIMIQNENGRGAYRHGADVAMGYIERDITPRITDFKKKYGQERNPFTGIWCVWYKFRTYM